MKTHKYDNYNQYVSEQRKGYEAKKNKVWAVEENIKEISEYLIKRNAKYGLCHGTRGGFEQSWFKKYIPESSVIGTEIGDSTAPDTIKKDFNKQYKELIGKFDFIYSNSFDHAYDPKKTINIWFDQLVPGGVLILEWDRRNEHTGEISKPVNKLDCVSMTFEELKTMIPQWNDKIENVVILDLPVITKGFRKAICFEVKKNEQ